MKHMAMAQTDVKQNAALMIGLSLLVGVPDVVLAVMAYLAIGSHGLLAYAGLLLTGGIAMGCVGALVVYVGELSKSRIPE
jgi:hypothetical protein